MRAHPSLPNHLTSFAATASVAARPRIENWIAIVCRAPSQASVRMARHECAGTMARLMTLGSGGACPALVRLERFQSGRTWIAVGAPQAIRQHRLQTLRGP